MSEATGDPSSQANVRVSLDQQPPILSPVVALGKDVLHQEGAAGSLMENMGAEAACLKRHWPAKEGRIATEKEYNDWANSNWRGRGMR